MISARRFRHGVLGAYPGAAVLLNDKLQIVDSNRCASLVLRMSRNSDFLEKCADVEQAKRQIRIAAGSSGNTLFVLDMVNGSRAVVYGARLMVDPGDDPNHGSILLRFDTEASLASKLFAASHQLKRMDHLLRNESYRRQQLEADNALLRQTVNRDPRTQLLTQEGLDAELAKRTAKGDAPMVLIFVDLDEFKTINDTLGHAAGNLAISEIGRIIRESLGRDDFAARVGGDEFAIVLSGLRTRSQVSDYVAQLHRNLSYPFDYHDPITGVTSPIRISFSAGVARFPQDTTEIAHVQMLADRAMYEAKDKGLPTGVFSQALTHHG